MTAVATAWTDRKDDAAGEHLASQIAGAFRPSAVIVFASAVNDYEALLRGLAARLGDIPIVGCSSAGEFSQEAAGTGTASAFAIQAPEMAFNAVLGTGLAGDVRGATGQVVAGLRGARATDFRYRTALIFVDGLAGYTEELMEQLTAATAGRYRFAGGGAGDDGAFRKTHVFLSTRAYTDAVVALEILSDKPIGIGARHGWTPASAAMRVTDADEKHVASLNVAPAAEVFAEHAASTGQQFDPGSPLPFFLHNVMGIATEDGHKLRVPLAVTESGGVATAAHVPRGATAHIMTTGGGAAAEAAAGATRDAVAQVQRAGHQVAGALFFDCIATRLRLGNGFAQELAAVKTALDDRPFVGFNSYGQIVRAEGQFSGFHNCTAVVATFPD